MKKKSVLKPVYASVFLSLVFCFTSTIYAETNTELREEDNIQIGGSWGPHIPTILAPTVSIAYGISGSTFFGLEYGANPNSEINHVIESSNPDCLFLFFGCSGGHTRKAEMEGEYINQGAFIRYHPWDTFYIFIAYHQRTFDGDLVGLDDSDEEVEAEINIRASTATIGIGNQWNFSSGIFIGASWVTVSRLIDSSVEYEITKTTGLSAAEIEEWENDIEDTGEHINNLSSLMGFAILTIGFAF